MTKQAKTRVLLLPADAPPRRSTIRRLMLYFDSVTLPNVTDCALINSGEIVEEFDHPTISKIEWGARGLFPRAPGYDEALAELVSETESLQNRQLLQFLPRRTPSDPARWLISYHAAIANEHVVRAAVPDIDPKVKPSVPSTMLVGAAMAPAGFKSRYDIPFKNPVDLPEAPAWGALALLRVGRVVKYLERARALDLAPFAADAPNAHLCVTLAGYAEASLSDAEIADVAIAFDLVDQEELERALLPLTWNEVLDLRREILPNLAKVRQKLLETVAGLGLPGESLSEYRKQVRTLREKLEATQSEVNKKWRELGLASVLRGGGAAGGLAALETFIVPTTWNERLLRAVGLALVTGAKLAPELKRLYTAHKNVHDNPLFHIDEAVLRRSHSR